METLVYVFVFITATMLFFILGQIIFAKNQLIGNRLDSITSMYALSEEEDEMRKPFAERVINPIYQKIIDALGSITPASINEKYEKIIMQAGVGKSFTPNSILFIQVMLALVMGGVFFAIFRLRGLEVNTRLVLLIGLLGFFWPYVRLNSTASKRKKKVQKTLPDLLDLLYISVEAGLGFDMALKKSSEKMPGPLSDEINKAMDDIAKGRDRQDALRGIVRRTGVEDLNNFITAVIQSEQLGTNISNMLRTQSTVMRQKRRQRAQEAAMKIPVKMLFPLIIFMFPSLFVVILGPAAISIMENLADIF